MSFLSPPLNVLLMHSKFAPSEGHLERLRAAAQGTVTVARSEAAAWDGIADAHIVIGHRYLRQSLPNASCLQWVQSTGSGVDRLPLDDLKRRGVRLTSNPSANRLVARHAVVLAWAMARQIPSARDRQVLGQWDNGFTWPALPKRAMIFGYGTIGAEIARILTGDGIETHVVVRQARNRPDPNVARFYTDSWWDVLPEMDWVLLALPNTPETVNLFGEQTLRQMRSGAILVNVGRGNAIDLAALRIVLEAGHLGGAALDVIDPKPQSADDDLWRMPRLMLTPHVAAHAIEAAEWFEVFMEDQLSRALKGEPLKAEVAL
ncbi:MAG: NAD(P)-dependent oxidoreductase [Pseudomonadota bacterium]